MCGGYDGSDDGDHGCDDNNGWANPEAAEICDGVDNDCNGLIDETCALSDALKDLTGGCNCDSSGGSTGLWMAGLLALFARRRRR